MNDSNLLSTTDYARIERAIGFIADHFREQPDLERMASEVQLSAPHFNRLFRRWAGVTPKQFVQRLTLDAAKWQLQQAHSVMRAALESGLSGPSRLHDLFITLEAMTPGEYKSGGAGLTLSYGVAHTPFGPAWLAWNERGLCQLEFDDQHGLDEQQLLARWPNANWRRDDTAATVQVQGLFDWPNHTSPALRLLVHGSNFQLQVWRALLQLDAGAFTDYGTLARQIQRPSAARAVGNAVGANPLLCLIPCHRVLRAHGGLGGYRGGVARKQVILAWEYSRALERS